MKIEIMKLCEDAVIPTYGTAGAGAGDLYCVDEMTEIAPGETCFLHTGIAVAIPVGYVGLVFARSGLSCKQDLAPANKVGVIDADYRGEIMVALHNHGTTKRTIRKGDRIAQLAILPVSLPEWVETKTLPETERGNGGFGSTGK